MVDRLFCGLYLRTSLPISEPLAESDKVGIPMLKKEFHCKGEFKGIHKGRPNDDLKVTAFLLNGEKRNRKHGFNEIVNNT